MNAELEAIEALRAAAQRANAVSVVHATTAMVASDPDAARAARQRSKTWESIAGFINGHLPGLEADAEAGG